MAEELDIIASGKALIAEIPEDFGSAVLSGSGIPISTGVAVEMRDGSSDFPTALPKLAEKDITNAFRFMVMMNLAKELQALTATPGMMPLHLVSVDGDIFFEPLAGVACFDPEKICECVPDWIAGWADGGETLCLRRHIPDVVEDIWISTDSVDISGAGIETNPYRASVKISLAAGNRLKMHPDGLFVGEVVEATSGPTTLAPTTVPMTTMAPTTMPPTTYPPTTPPPTTPPPTTVAPTSLPPTTLPPTTTPPTTPHPTTIPPTTYPPTTPPPTTGSPTTPPPTTPPPMTTPPTTIPPTTPGP